MAGQLTNDLVVVFGFSRFNADWAVNMYQNNRLSIEQMDDFYYLETHPFKGNNCTNKELPTVREGMIERLEHLNYIMTEAGGKAK